MRHARAQAWAEARLQRWDAFLSYARVLIQFGYVTFFSWTFPLAPALALAYNLLSMRMEAARLCYDTQRPIAHKAGGIGVWAHVLEGMVLLAVLTNCAHPALASKQFAVYFPGLSDGTKVLLIFCIEHAVLGLRLLLPQCVPATPAAVKRRMARDALALARLQQHSQQQAQLQLLGAGGRLSSGGGFGAPPDPSAIAALAWGKQQQQQQQLQQQQLQRQPPVGVPQGRSAALGARLRRSIQSLFTGTWSTVGRGRGAASTVAPPAGDDDSDDPDNGGGGGGSAAGGGSVSVINSGLGITVSTPLPPLGRAKGARR